VQDVSADRLRPRRAGARWQHDRVDTFALIADERLQLADLLSGLTREQQATQSLCDAWTVHDVAAHLAMPLTVSMPRFALAMLACRGNFDRANDRLTREQARRPLREITGLLRQKASSSFTPPGAGPEAPLTDLLIHGADIRWPLGLKRDIPEERLQAALTFLTDRSARGVVAKGVLDGLRFEADDLAWAHGNGPVVRGAAEALMLAVSGRGAALARLSGDGLATLRARVA
jgi:uncharacterized protein (TIGR03083 family)